MTPDDIKEVKCPVQLHYAGGYRLEYDGKYITLWGRDNRYEQFKWRDDQETSYEEMVLDACVIEIRNANPVISEVTDSFITIKMNRDE